jgi:NAD(P)-dependent dehydrogenase (short-subunit alcohol dehydrogenase family)
MFTEAETTGEMLNFKDKVVLITGAAQGFGRVLAYAFAERGAKIALCDINDEGGEETLAKVTAQGADGFYQHADVSQESDVEGFVAATVERFGRLDVAINNAAKEIAGPTLNLPSEDFDTVTDTNLKGTYYGMKHQVAQMRKNGGGAIVNQTSVTSSITGVPDNGLYAATKGGIIGLTKPAALQVASENISINAIASCAFDIPNDLFLRWLDDHHVTRDEAAEWVPIKRLGRPEEIAAATLYLASDEARFVVGHVLTIDGGFTAQ